MADPVVVLVAPAASSGAALRNRLLALGLRCEIIDSSGPARGWRAVEGDVILVLEEGTYSGVSGVLLGRREGTDLEGLPILILGQGPPLSQAEAAEVDETLPLDAPDRTLLERLRVWSRWGLKVKKLREVEAQARDLQAVDSLTGLPGHRAFHDRLEMEVRRSTRYDSPVGLIVADVAGMRGLNDRLGHRSGDRILREAGVALRRGVRDVDTVSRYEGDAFAIVLPESGPETTEKVVERLRSLISSLIFRGEAVESGPSPLLKITMHFGHASLPDPEIRGKAALIAAAEAALSQDRAARAAPASS